MTEPAHGWRLAETFLAMINTHDPGLLGRFVAGDYRDHDAFASDVREANREFWTALFAAVPGLTGGLDEAADDAVAGDDQVLDWVRRTAEHARRFVRAVTEASSPPSTTRSRHDDREP